MNFSNILKSRASRVLCLIAVTLIIGACAITTQSFWMDEGNAIFKAMMPSLRDMWNFSTHLGGSEIQMPFFMLSLWGWEKLVPSSEYFLRAINLPFLVVMVLAFRNQRFWPLVCLTSPFVLYYLGELRPYMMQMAGAAIGFSALCRILRTDPEEKSVVGLHVLFFSSIFLATTSLTAAVCSFGLVLGLIVARPQLLAHEGFWKRIVVWIPLAFVVAGYYGFTLIEGYRATGDRGRGLLSMAFGFYEMIGMMGLGPGRDELRSGNLPALLASHPWLPFAALIVAAAWTIGVREFAASFPLRAKVGLACSVAVPVVAFAAVGLLANFSVLGRHMSPLIPALLVPLACTCDLGVRNLRAGNPWVAAIATAALAVAIVSSIQLRVSPRHEREDYRRATEMAIDALQKGKTIMWRADMNTVRFYAQQEGGMAMVHYVQRLESEVPTSLMFTDLIFINRPDLRFGDQDYRKPLADEGFDLIDTFSGFEVWQSRYLRER